MAKKYCPNCGEEVRKSYLECPNCGIDLALEDDFNSFEDDNYFNEETDDEIDADSIPDISDDMPALDDLCLW